MNDNIKKAGEYMYNNMVPPKFGTGALSVSTETCYKIQALIERNFSLSHSDFTEAFKLAEFMANEEGRAEVAFFRSHPELNP